MKGIEEEEGLPDIWSLLLMDAAALNDLTDTAVETVLSNLVERMNNPPIEISDIRRSELAFGLPTPRVQAHDNRFS